MKKTTVQLIVFIFLVLTCVSAGQVNEAWVSTYNGPSNGNDFAKAIVTDVSGNLYVTGWSVEIAGSDYDYYTIKYNSSGVQQWAQRYNGPGDGFDATYSIAVDASGNVYVTGESEGSTSNHDIATIKYNSSGVQQWVKRYNGSGNNADLAYIVTTDASGNVFVAGAVTGSGTGLDFVTIKYNSAGDQQWISFYNGPGNYSDVINSLLIDGTGNLCVTGPSNGTGANVDYATIKYNSAGVQQWVSRYNGPGNESDHPTSMALDASGNIYVTGQSRGTTTNYDFATIKYNSAGTEQWVSRYNGLANNWDDASSIAVDASGNVYVTGKSIGSGTSYDYATVKYNSSGAEQWVSRYNGPLNNYDTPFSLVLDASGNVYVSGNSGAVSNYDFATIKYNSSGAQQWLQRYNGPSNSSDEAAEVILDASGNVYVTGASYQTGQNFNYITIKYSQVTGLQQNNIEIPSEFFLHQNYPNPFNPETNIEFQIPEAGFVDLQIFDLTGRSIETIVSENLVPGSYNVTWNATAYSSGMYFYKLTTGKYIETKKMMLIK